MSAKTPGSAHLEVVSTRVFPAPREGVFEAFSDPEDAGRTELTWRMLFEPHDEPPGLKSLVAAANEQNFDRLEEHLASTP